MTIQLVQNRKRVQNEVSFPKPVSRQQDPGSISTFDRITGGKSGSDHLRRQVLTVEKVMRDNRPIIVEIQNASSLQTLKDRMSFSDAFFVIEPIVELIATPLLGERQPPHGILLPLKRQLGKEYHHAASCHTPSQFPPNLPDRFRFSKGHQPG